jgi:TPR repeat protein
MDNKSNEDLNKINLNEKMSKIDNVDKIIDFNERIDNITNFFKEGNEKLINQFIKNVCDLFIKKSCLDNLNNNNEISCEELYYFGIYYQFIDINYDLAEKYYLEAADKGIILAMHNLGDCYYQKKKYDLSEKYYFRAADKGCIKSMYSLGKYYDLIKKYDLMKKYYLQAIEKGHEKAMHNLGYYYQYTEINYDLMKKYYLQAIDKGCDESMYNLGKYYKQEEKYDLMKKYYLRAVEKGNSDAMYKLGWYYQSVEINYDLMKKYYLQLIDKGNVRSKVFNNFGTYYLCIEKKYDLAKKYFILAIDKNNGNDNDKGYICALNNIGYYYQHIEKNYDLMKKYYLMVTEKGKPVAMYNLGCYYRDIEKDYSLMKMYFLMAIDKENYNAMFDLGYYYRNVEKNYDLMKKYYLQAVEKGSVESLGEICNYFIYNMPNDEDLQNLLLAVLKSNQIYLDNEKMNILWSKQFIVNKLSDLFCKFIDSDLVCVANFEFCATGIINHINNIDYINNVINFDYKFKYLDHFMEYIGKLYCGKCKGKHCESNDKSNNKINDKSTCKIEYKECLMKILKSKVKVSRLFIMDLPLYYEKYIEKKYAPGGSKFDKTEKHFKLMAKEQELNKK